MPLAVFVLVNVAVQDSLERLLPRVLHISSDIVYLALLGLLYLTTVVLIRAYRRHRPSFLASPNGYKAFEAAAPLIAWISATYLASALIFGGVALAWVDRSDWHWPMKVLFAAIFVPLVFALPAGTLAAWSRVVARER